MSSRPFDIIHKYLPIIHKKIRHIHSLSTGKTVTDDKDSLHNGNSSKPIHYSTGGFTTLTHVSLFTGIGGIDIAADWAGFKTIAQVENEPYPLKVLAKHWPDVPKFHDIRTFKGSDLNERPTVLSGGFPCQPFSVAGEKKGKEDNRYLWPEMCRVIGEVRPTWVIGENVRGLVRIALDTVYEDLENLGYAVQSFLIPALGFGAPHKRERIFIVGHTTGTGLSNWAGITLGRPTAFAQSKRPNSNSLADAARFGRYTWGTKSAELQRLSSVTIGSSSLERPVTSSRSDWWTTEPSVGRVAHGVPHRVDRIRALGNAVVPQQIYPIFAAIAAIENGGQPHDPNHP